MKRLSTIVLLLLASFHSVVAQTDSNSPYSDQAFDPNRAEPWYQSPFLWLGIVAIIAIIVYFLMKNRQSSPDKL